MAKKDYYDVLVLNVAQTKKQLNVLTKKLAMQYHLIEPKVIKPKKKNLKKSKKPMKS